MSDFKFACPVCGQHIRTDSSATGKELECPTCFQRIIIPQAPASPDSKLVVTSSQVGKSRPVGAGFATQDVRPPRQPLWPAICLLLLLGALAVGAYVYRDRLSAWLQRAVRSEQRPGTNQTTQP